MFVWEVFSIEKKLEHLFLKVYFSDISPAPHTHSPSSLIQNGRLAGVPSLLS